MALFTNRKIHNIDTGSPSPHQKRRALSRKRHDCFQFSLLLPSSVFCVGPHPAEIASACKGHNVCTLCRSLWMEVIDEVVQHCLRFETDKCHTYVIQYMSCVYSLRIQNTKIMYALLDILPFWHRQILHCLYAAINEWYRHQYKV